MKKYNELEMEVVIFSNVDVIEDSVPQDTRDNMGEWMP